MTMDTNNGRFVWHENLTKDPKAAISFYTDLAGWTTQLFPGNNDYTLFVGSQGPLGGVMKLPDEAVKAGMPPTWMAHVHVADVAKTAELAKASGGKVMKEPSDIPTVGRFAVISDPQGASLAIFTPSSHMELHDAFKAGEFCWNELMTSDSAAAFDFYSKLFGWTIHQEMDMGPMGVYRIYGLGDKQFGGMMTTPPGAPMPPMWIYYIETPDLEAALERAKKNGAQVMNGPMDVPGGGRIAQLTDPQGAVIALHQAPKK